MEKDSYILRDMRLEDIPSCKRIVESYWGEEVAEQASDEMIEMFDSFQRWPPHYYVIQDLESGDVLAFAGYKAAWLMSNTYELIWINVRKDMTGKGLGKTLTVKRLTEIKNRGGTLVLLMTKKPQFFEKFGFESTQNIDGWILMIHRITSLALGSRK